MLSNEVFEEAAGYLHGCAEYIYKPDDSRAVLRELLDFLAPKIQCGVLTDAASEIEIPQGHENPQWAAKAYLLNLSSSISRNAKK